MSYLGANTTVEPGGVYVSGTKRTDWYNQIQGTANATMDGVLYLEQSYDPLAETDPENAIWDYSRPIEISGLSSATTSVNEGIDTVGLAFSEPVYAPFWRFRYRSTAVSDPTDIRVHARCQGTGVSTRY